MIIHSTYDYAMEPSTRHRRRSLPIVYLIYLAFQVDPEEVGAGGIY